MGSAGKVDFNLLGLDFSLDKIFIGILVGTVLNLQTTFSNIYGHFLDINSSSL
jgi:predicted branched-subunit amino acid permease